MSYIALNNFKAGLDTRRSELSSVPGSLIVAQDGHINEGGEFEKRLAFVSEGQLPAGSGYTFGLETVSNGVMVFGSAASGTVGALPTNTVYQQLVFPAVAEGGAALAMTGILCSTSFGGFAWVVAQFSDGSIFGYYNGTVIPAFRNGIVLTGLTSNLNIATHLSTAIGQLSGYHVTGITASGGSQYFDAYVDAGISWIPTAAVLSSASGTITAAQRTIQTIGTTEALAIGGFSVFAGATGTITSITVNNVEILGSTVNFTTDAATTVGLLVTTMNNFVSSPKYTAAVTSAGNGITISATTGSGAGANGFVVKVTTTGDVCVDNTFFTLPAGSGNACQFVKINGATDILGATVTQTTTVAAWATAIAAAINGFQATYNACAVNTSVYISKKVRASNDTFETTVSVSLTTGSVSGSTGSGGSAPAFTVAITPLTSTVAMNGSRTSRGTVPQPTTSGTLSCITSGGVAPFSYTWLAPLTPSGSTINAIGSSATLTVVATGTYKVTCKVTDSSPSPLTQTATCTVVFSF